MISMAYAVTDLLEQCEQGTDTMETPGRQGLPANYLATSTPFARTVGLEEGAIVDTPGRSDDPNDDEMRYLNTSRSSDQLEILYRARGTEIERLKAELSVARDETGLEARRLRHDLALSKGRVEELAVQLEQETEVNKRVTEENAALRADVELLKLALRKQEKVKAELEERAESSDHVLQTLQAQLEQLQMSDTALRDVCSRDRLSQMTLLHFHPSVRGISRHYLGEFSFRNVEI